MPRPLAAAGLVALAALASPAPRPASSPLRAGDRVVLVGGALAERQQHDGWLETRLQLGFPELRLSVRNLGFSADTLTVRQRTEGFGRPEEWLSRARADVVFAFFGFNESFEGPDGLDAFRRDLRAWVEHVRSLSSPKGEALRVLLFSSVPYANPGSARLPDGRAMNERLALYDAVQAEVARDLGIPFVDLATPMRERQARGADGLTINGVHLTAEGHEVLADAVARAFGVDARPDPDRAEAVRAVVREKNLLWFNRYQATDGYNVYGGRSSLKYEGVTNFEVLQRELEVLDAMCDALDGAIRAVARGEPRPALPAIGEGGIPPRIEVATNLPGEGEGGAHVYLSGEEALAKMTSAPGTRVELFADEARFPVLANPVQMSFDTRGRLWVAVWPTYPHWEPDRPMDDKLLVFEDDDGDGRADRVEVFADDLHNPTGFEFWNGGVLVANPPDVLFLADTDGDGRADRRERVLHGLGSGDTHHSANSFVLGPEGALYFQEGIFHHSQVETIHGPVRNHDACVWRFEPRTGRVERYVPYDFLNPHGHVFDRWGQDFVTDGTTNENYWVLPFSGHLDEPRKHPKYFPFFAQRSRPAAATEILSSRHFPPESRGNYLIANVIGFRGIFQYAIEADGAGFTAREVDPLVFSADPNFRPVDIEVGPDGAVWFLDWHSALIGHMQHHLRDPSRDHEHGRVYRVVHEGRPLLEPEPIAGRPTVELLERLKSPDDRVRYRARLELGGRDSREVIEAARAWSRALESGDPEVEHHRLEALWVQLQHDAVDQGALEELLAARDPRARAAAVRVVRHARARLPDPLRLLERAVTDPHPRVRAEAVVACSFLPGARSVEIALRALERPTDRFLEYALAETVRGRDVHWRATLAAGEPLAFDAPGALAYLVARLADDELASLCAAAVGGAAEIAAWRERLSRPGLRPERVAAALQTLARLESTTPEAQFIGAVARADAAGDEHADHRLMDLFAGLRALGAQAADALSDELAGLARDGARLSTRRLALRARLEAHGQLERTWLEAQASPAALADLLDAACGIDEPALAAALFERVRLLVGAPAGDAAESPAGGPCVELRRAAVRALAALARPAGRTEEAVLALAPHIDDERLGGSVVAALRGLPADAWPAETRDAIARALIERFEAAAGEPFASPAERELLPFADEIAPYLEAALARRLARARRPLGPQVIVIRPVPDSLLYDRAEFSVVAGRAVELVFDNVDIMPHNLVVTAPGALARVGRAADRMASDPAAAAREYVPDLDEVLFATRLLRPGERQVLEFTAPETPGDHPYLCTFPGHWLRMNGVMHVVAGAGDLVETEAVQVAAPGRAFVREWTANDLLPHLASLDARSPESGRAVLEAASCLQCHAIRGEGGRTAPDLVEVAGRRDAAELLIHVLEPSREILEGFGNEIFFLHDGTLRAGRVTIEEDGRVLLQTDPYAESEPVEVALADVEERVVSDLSSMPSGLLSTFQREEILDLVAYLRSLAFQRSPK